MPGKSPVKTGDRRCDSGLELVVGGFRVDQTGFAPKQQGKLCKAYGEPFEEISQALAQVLQAASEDEASHRGKHGGCS